MLIDFFDECLENLQCRNETKSYIIDLFSKFKSESVLHSKSITVAFSEAKFKNNFHLYQQLGDWLFWANVLYPSCLNGASEEYYTNVARLSYLRCYRLLDRKWLLFEELSDDYIKLVNSSKRYLQLKCQLDKPPGIRMA